MARPSMYHLNRESVLVAVAGLAKHGTPPTLRELSDVTGLPISTLHSYVNRMHDEGLITWHPRSHRSIRITSAGQALVQ
jgi:DNA-binding IclR family transcriptional regulator